MSQVPRASVVIPTYDRCALVLEAVESVLYQTMPEFEVIVVDDGSTDGTASALRSQYGGDSRFRILQRQENAGTARARNLGVALCRAPFVAFLDSDDLWLPSFLEAQLAVAASQPAADLVLCDARYEGPGKHQGETVFGRRSWRPPSSMDAMCAGAWGLPSCMLLRKGVLRQIPFDTSFRYTEDTAFLFAFHERGLLFVENPQVLVRYRTHTGVGAPQKVASGTNVLLEHLQLLETYAPKASHPGEVSVQIARKRARFLMRQGRWREARSVLWRWWRGRPTSRHAFLGLLRSLLPRASAVRDPPPPLGAAPPASEPRDRDVGGNGGRPPRVCYSAEDGEGRSESGPGVAAAENPRSAR